MQVDDTDVPPNQPKGPVFQYKTDPAAPKDSTDNGRKRKADDEDPESDGSSDEESSDGDDEEEEETALPKTTEVTATVLDKDEGLAITGGKIVNQTITALSTLAFPPPGSLTLHTVNPLLNSARFEFASTSDLPYEIQLWWQLYHKAHVTVKDIDLWAIVTILSQKKKSNLFELIKRVFTHCANYFELIIGPGSSRFFLIRFKSVKTKENLQKDNRHDRGVFVSFIESKQPTALLIFDLEPITPTTPTMSSLLVTMHGLPFPLHTNHIADTVWGSIACVKSNFKYKLQGVREINKKPIIAHGGGRVFEILFDRTATIKWFKLLSRSNKYLEMVGWDSKGLENEDTYLVHIRYLPTCSQCGTTSHDGAHLAACPFIKIRDSISKALGRDPNPPKSTSLDETTSATPIASTSNPQPQKKVGNFTVRD
ncbi:hypothetical protein DFH28DRAFT_920458 [Melampsora americana]|nr:hypothetical protein DFH28DRAFT_920458 [Melampsora americana]